MGILNSLNLKSYNWLYFILILLITTVVYVADITIKTDKIKEIKIINNLFKNELSECIKKNQNLQISKVRLVDIKNENDLMRRDIKLYIKSRYTKVPLIVAESISKNIMKYSEQYNISPELILGMIEIESRFNPMAVSKKNARGLMQVMPEWVPKLGLKSINNLHDIDTGIESGIKVFQIHLAEAKGNISKGLYLYVGKSKTYSELVYGSIGKFVIFRTTIDDDKITSEGTEENGNNEPAGTSHK